MKFRIRIPRPDVDVRDVHFYGGLVLAGVGLAQVSPALAAVVVGGALAAVGYFMPRRAKS